MRGPAKREAELISDREYAENGIPFACSNRWGMAKQLPSLGLTWTSDAKGTTQPSDGCSYHD